MKRAFAIAIVLALAALFAARPAAAAPAPDGYLLNMYHFNLQYVAGNERAMAEGVETGLEPLLDVYLRHPGWKADFELQGMFVEYLADRYPAVLAKLKKLADNGQAEIVSFHYSDQLLLAFPALDQERSLQLNKEIFAAHGLPLSGIVFTQEAQFGEGMCALAKKHGFRAAVMTANSYNWFQNDPGLPVFSCRDFLVIKGADPDHDPMLKQEGDWADPSGIKVKWYFIGDGELVVTGGASPYSVNFRPKPDLVKKMEDNFAALAAEGYRTATVSEWLDAVAAHGLQPRPLKPMLDAAWRPQDDQGLFTWLGKHELPWENDRQVRTQNYEARSWLIAAEGAGIGWDRLAPLWRLQLEAEVSDSTGWFPMPGELRYSRSRSRAVIAGVKEICPACAPSRFAATIRPGEVTSTPAPEITGAWWSKVEYFATDRPGLTAVKVAMVPGADGRIAFKIAGDALAYCPAFIEREVVHIPFADIKPVRHYVGLPNGLIGLGPNRWLIRDNRAGFIGAGIDTGEHTVDFRIAKRPGRLYRFTFYVFEGDEPAALKLANEINETGQ